MVFDTNFLNSIYIKRFIAGAIDFGFALGSGLLGGYFGAMMAALVIVLHDVSPAGTQKAIWVGMGIGFFFWSVVASLMNRVVVQGISRATIGKKFMNLEIVSTGAPISWRAMLKHWMSATLIGEIKVISVLDESKIATVYSIHAQPIAVEESSDKKAA